MIEELQELLSLFNCNKEERLYMYQSTFWLPRLEEKLLSQPITRATKEHKKHLGPSGNVG